MTLFEEAALEELKAIRAAVERLAPPAATAEIKSAVVRPPVDARGKKR